MNKILRRSFISKSFLFILTLLISPIKLWAKKECVTGKDITGPFYRKGAPIRDNLAKQYKGKGIVLTVNGTVYRNDCNRPLQNAILDIWHASPEGKYDNNTDAFLFRGITETDKNGNYEFETVFPGYYAGRPRHIHLKVRHKDYKELTTQLYFMGDKKLKSDNTIKLNQGEKRALICSGTSEMGYGSRFNIYLSNQ